MCESQGDFNQNCNELKSKLTEGGYKEEEIDWWKHEAHNIKRNEALK